MAKDWEDKGYWGKYNSLNKIGESLGINYQDYSDNETETGRNYTKKGTREDFENAVLSGMQNSAVYQDSLKYGKDSGNKRFEDLGDGISNPGEANALFNAMKGTHKDMGNTGSFSSANDRGNVASQLFDDSREDFKQDIIDDLGDSLSTKKDDDDDDKEPETPIGSYRDYYPESLNESVAKATSGYNADGTPAQQSADALLNDTLNKVAKDKDKMGLGNFRQGLFVLDNLGSNKFSSGTYSS